MYASRRGVGFVSTGAPEAMGPPVDPSMPVGAPDVQQQIADVWSVLLPLNEAAMPGAGGAGAPGAVGVASGLGQYGPLLLVAGAVFLVLVVSSSSRR